MNINYIRDASSSRFHELLTDCEHRILNNLPVLARRGWGPSFVILFPSCSYSLFATSISIRILDDVGSVLAAFFFF